MKSIFLIITVLLSFGFSSERIEFSQKEKEFLNTNPTITYSEVNWKPLSIIEKNSMNGIMGDYLKLVQEKTGINFQFTPSDSWPDVLKKFEEGKIDLVPGIGTSPQETKLGLVSKTYAEYPMVIVTDRKYSYFNDMSELNGKTVAVPKYYTSYNFLVENYPNINLITTKSIPDALLLVETQKADAFVGHIATSLYYISSNNLNNLKVSGKTDFIFEHKYLIQKDNPILESIINKAFDSITSLERKNIYSKWVQTTVTEEKINYTLLLQIVILFLIVVAVLAYRHFSLKVLHNKLKDAKDEIEGIFDTTMEAIIISENRKIINVNKEALRLFEYLSKEELIGKDLFDLIAPDSRDIIKNRIQNNINKQYEINALKSSGKKFLALTQGNNIKLQNRYCRISSIIDITDLKEKDQLLLEQSKMASMGEMIGNIAHQWRQPLSAISMLLSTIKVEKEIGILNDKDFNKKIDDSLDYVNHLSTTIETFRDFIKGDKTCKKISLQEIINKTLDIVSSSLRSKNIRIYHNIQKVETIELIIVPDELIQVIVNILNNAKDVLSQENQNNKKEKWINIEINQDNNNVILSIEDNGGGIKENIIQKIFDPYFTTKHKSQGTGLGLHMSYRLVTESLNGKIYVKNTQDGAKFFIELPNKH